MTISIAFILFLDYSHDHSAQGLPKKSVRDTVRTRPPSLSANLRHAMGSLIKKRRKRMRKKKHKKMLKRTRWQRRAAGK